jgi:MATE family multidrug resistance protein
MDAEGRGAPLGGALPAQRFDATGRARIDWRAIAQLTLPLMANSSLQAVISLTDTWFVGQISTSAIAGMGAIYWFAFFFILLAGGIGLAVQTLVAQGEGGGRRARASRAVWTALWGTLLTVPAFVALAHAGGLILLPFDLHADVEMQALAFWQPRMFGAPLGVALWAVLGFFNGISRPRVTLITTGFVAVVNALLNELFIFHFHWGVAGSAWATNTSMLCGLALGIVLFLSGDLRRRYRSNLTWRPSRTAIARQFRIGLPMGFLGAADVFGLSLFQMMQVGLSNAEGAATQITTMLTSVSYLPGVGIALAGTTLVGQAIGAGDRAWARHLGNAIIALNVCFMGALGLLLALAGPWVVPAFVNSTDPDAARVVQLGIVLLWIAAGYQLFDGLNLASGFCLRGAGDAAVPAGLALILSWGLFIPLAHMLSFAPGQGWVDVLPQFGFGTFGGWTAMLVYVMALGTALFLRWRSSAWQRIRL